MLTPDLDPPTKGNVMQEDELAMLIAQIAALVARSEQRDASMEQRQHALEQRLSSLFDEKVDDCLRTVAGQAGGVVREGLRPSIDDCQQQMHGLTAEAGQAAQMLNRAKNDAASQRRIMWWGMGAIMLACLVSLVINYEMLYGEYRQKYDRLLVAVPYMDAVSKSDVVPCGDGRLCARIDDKAPRVGDGKQYRLVEPRK
jgi:hypothetical protein